MEHTSIKVQMLGAFSISYHDVVLDANKNRSRKIWQLLAYLIYNRNRVISQEELIDVLWEDSDGQDNASGALNTIFWRTRQALSPIADLIDQNLIVRSKTGCMWNPDVPTEVDVSDFEAFYQKGKSLEDEDLRLDEFRKALALYQGTFLEKLSGSTWNNMVSVYYNNLYLDLLVEALPLIQERGYFEEVESLCQTALKIDPYNESIYQYLMRGLLNQNKYEEAAATYEKLRDNLSSQLGITPSEETQKLYREIQKNSSQYAVSPAMVRELLREDTPISGAIVCDFNFFKFFYQAEARSAVRRGDAVHIGVLSVTDDQGKELSDRSLNRAMENLQIQLQRSLRKSDVISRCSESQFVVLLLQANYENSCKVCDRVIQAFNRTYPHSPAEIHYTIIPLEPIQNR